MMNTVHLQGRLVFEPEMHTTHSGKPVTQVRLASAYGAPGAGDGKCNFLDVTFFEEQAEFVHSYFKKGQMMLVRGHLNQNRWCGPDGVRRQKVQIIGDAVYFTGNRREDTRDAEIQGL